MSARMIRRFMAAVALCLTIPLLVSAADEAAESKPQWPYFAFDNGAGRGRVPFEEQAKMLKELGYDGIAFSGAARIPEMLKALDDQGLKMLSIYVDANVDPGKPPYDPGLKAAVKQLKGRDVQIWLPIMGGKPSSDACDDRALAVVREIADMAAESGLRVSLYPHAGCYVQRVEDGLRLVKKADRGNVGVIFNLCHFLKCDNETFLEQRLKQAMPHLFAVSINGADGGDTNKMGWRNQLIQTLDRGNFDVGRVLKILRQSGYTGPVGLQCYDVPGDIRENLARSMSAWRKLNSLLGEP